MRVTGGCRAVLLLLALVGAPALAADASEIAFWESVRYSKDVADLRAYLERYPNGDFVVLARNRLSALQASVPIAKPPPPRARQSADKIVMQFPVAIGADAVIDPDVQQECKLPELIGERTFNQIKRREPDASVLQAAQGGERFIRFEIADARMIPALQIRRLTVAAEIVQDGKIVQSGKFHDKSAAMPGNGLTLCDIMGNIADLIGARIARWAPSRFRDLR